MITGSEYLLAMLFVIIIYPIILYIFQWLKKVFGKKKAVFTHYFLFDIIDEVFL